MKYLVIAAMGFGLMAATAWADGDATKGADVYKKCAACHSVADKTNKVGPFLRGVVGRKAAGADGYNYSEAMKTFAATGAIWDDATLDKYLADPKATIPSNKMPFAGLKIAEDRANLIAFLKTKM
jgi:cytochrome c